MHKQVNHDECPLNGQECQHPFQRRCHPHQQHPRRSWISSSHNSNNGLLLLLLLLFWLADTVPVVSVIVDAFPLLQTIAPRSRHPPPPSQPYPPHDDRDCLLHSHSRSPVYGSRTSTAAAAASMAMARRTFFLSSSLPKTRSSRHWVLRVSMQETEVETEQLATESDTTALKATETATATTSLPSSSSSSSSSSASFSVVHNKINNISNNNNINNNNNNNNNNSTHTALRYSHIPPTLRIAGYGIPGRREKIQLLDTRTYEAALIQQWDNATFVQQQQQPHYNHPGVSFNFDWEIEKLRRYCAGLRMREDGNWVRQPSSWFFLDFLVSPNRLDTHNTNYNNNNNEKDARRTPPRPVGMMDVAKVVLVNALTSLGLGPQLGMAAIPNAVIQKYQGSFLSFIAGVLGGDLQTLAGGPLFLLLAKYFHTYGPIFNLSFGPKSFLVISDPVMARHILRETSPDLYCKGMLQEILEPIMGNGLIPADPATWRVRRRALLPSFHKRWLNRMVTLFGDRAELLVHDLIQRQQGGASSSAVVVDMEERFCSVTLDIIGKAVFNYDFGSVTRTSPIVQAVYRVLREAEHRSSSFIPYWNLPYADVWMGKQVEFRNDMTLLDEILARLINSAVQTRREASIEELEARDNDDDPSLLRFLVDMRGEDLSSTVLRDDLMTMLIAGHETTAAMLTWTLFELSQGDPGLLKDVQHEVRTVLQHKSRPDYDDIVAMKKLRYCLIEALRLYPEPPVLIRRARADDTLPSGSSPLPGGIKLLRGTDLFISTWNLHRSPDLWEHPDRYDPTRWERPFTNARGESGVKVKGWDGFNPDKVTGLYPNEQATDFAFLPFGGGARKCIGDQFAMLEAVATMSMMIKHFDFDLAIPAEQVGMKTGATIHTMNGLMMRPKPVLVNNNNANVVVAEDVKDPDASSTVVAKTPAISKTEGWWEMQHLKRGFKANGRPYVRDDESLSRTFHGDDSPKRKRSLDSHRPSSSSSSPSSSSTSSSTNGSGCPMHSSNQ